MPSVPILDWALWIIDCYSCWSDQRITTTGLHWVEADALCWLDNVGLLFHLSNTDPQSELLALSVMVQVFTEEEGDPRERKQEAEIEDELKSRSLGWWIVILLCWCQWLPMHAHHEPVLITLYHNSIVLLAFTLKDQRIKAGAQTPRECPYHHMDIKICPCTPIPFESTLPSCTSMVTTDMYTS